MTQSLQTDEVRLLVEIGFIAAGSRQIANAEQIFGALKALRPDHAFPVIGLATAYLNVGRTVDAVRALEGWDRLPPSERDEAAAFRGLALHLNGQQIESRRMLAFAAKENPDTPAGRMARSLLRR